MIIETCPVCGHDLMTMVLCTYPPIPKKECVNCGWSWTGTPEKITRVPFVTPFEGETVFPNVEYELVIPTIND